MNAEELILQNIDWAKTKGVQLMKGKHTRALSWDIEQEALLGLVEAARDWSGEGDFRAYAYKCVHNQVLDAIRRAKRTAHYEIPMSMGVMDWLASQDFEEWLSWDRHVPSVGSLPCERDPLSP